MPKAGCKMMTMPKGDMKMDHKMPKEGKMSPKMGKMAKDHDEGHK